MKALDKKRVKSAARKLGFYAEGNFLIGARSDDVVSGFAIDGAPSSTYVWTFVLPVFDDLDFLHMSLGRRIINLGSLERPLEQLLAETWEELSSVRDAGQLIAYLDTEGVIGEYAQWTRFICLVRLGRFDRAEGMLETIEQLQAAMIPRKFSELKSYRRSGGWAAVQDLLVEWSTRTAPLLSGHSSNS